MYHLLSLGAQLNSFQFSGNSFQANNVMLKEGKKLELSLEAKILEPILMKQL